MSPPEFACDMLIRETTRLGKRGVRRLSEIIGVGVARHKGKGRRWLASIDAPNVKATYLRGLDSGRRVLGHLVGFVGPFDVCG